MAGQDGSLLSHHQSVTLRRHRRPLPGGFVVAGQKFQLSQLRVDGLGIYAAVGREP